MFDNTPYVTTWGLLITVVDYHKQKFHRIGYFEDEIYGLDDATKFVDDFTQSMHNSSLM
jgi:hypothetical protein